MRPKSQLLLALLLLVQAFCQISILNQVPAGVDPKRSKVALCWNQNKQFAAVNSLLNLVVSQTKIDLSATFNLIDLGNSKVAFEFVRNGRFVCTENAGNKFLVADRSAIGPWETFKIQNVNGGIALKA